jgi:hypothetical protein
MRILVRLGVLALLVSAFFATDVFLGRTEAQKAKPEGVSACLPPPPGMVGWWPGEGNGDDIRGENNGALENVGFAPAKVDHGFTFSGLRGVVVPDSDVLNQQRFTIESWATLTPFTCSPPGSCAAFVVAKSGSTGNFGYELDVREDGTVNFFINGGVGGGVVTSLGTFADGNFHHLAATYDGSQMRLYIDGVLNNSKSFVGIVNYEANSPFVIGGRQLAGPTVTYPGIIDEPAFYSRALTATEIRLLSDVAGLGKCRPRCTTESLFSLEGWWTGDDNAFDIWNQNHGIEISQAAFTYTTGKVGRGFNFDGTSEVRIPASDDLNVGNFNGFTVDAWINPNVIDDQPIVEWSNGFNNVGVNLWMLGNIGQAPQGVNGAGRLFADIVDTEGQSHQIVSSEALITTGSFHHVALTYDNQNQTAVLYVNGVNVATKNFDTSFFIPQTSYDVHIGARPAFGNRPAVRPNGLQGVFFKGVIDEVEIFAQTLGPSEIQNLNNAAFSGKCKPCLFPPFSMVGWWTGDGNTRDDSHNGNTATLQGGYRVGKVGQAYSLKAASNDGLVVTNSPSISPTTAITLDAWVNPSSYQNNPAVVFRKGTDYSLTIGDGESNGIAVCRIGNPDNVPISGGSVPLNTWTHVACTFDSQSAQTRLYVNGIQVAGVFSEPTLIPNSDDDLGIGKSLDSTTQGFDGLIDEAEIFDRELSEDEIQSLVAAGPSGKCKLDLQNQKRPTAPAPDGPFTVVLGDATITYSDLLFPGNTSYQTFDTYQTGPMPFGYAPPLEVVDISSEANFNGPVNICFNLQASEFSAPFQQLRILHLEGNELVNRTTSSSPTTRTLCASVTSLSPFVIAQNVTVPSASTALITGRITLPDGSPLAGAVLQLSGAQSRETITDAEGFYTFTGVRADSFYTVTPQRANFTFSPRDRSFSVLGSRTEAAFTAVASAVPTQNPLDTDLFFVRQQYLDFLGREPDQGGLEYWTGQLRSCGGDSQCLMRRRLEVSAAFFDSGEFQQTGSFIYRLYQGSLGRHPGFTEFSADQRSVLGQAGAAGFSEQFVQRPEFAQRYQSNTTGESFVAAVIENVRQSTGVDLSSDYANLLAKYNTGSGINQSRALVVSEIGRAQALQQGTYNAAFVLMEYFGYLRRDPDPSGYAFWLDVLNNRTVGNYRGMVCAFVTSAEYQHRFSPIVTSSNADCGQ